MQRRLFAALASVAALATLAAAPVVRAQGGKPEPARLNVYNWNDYIAKDTVADFEKATGVKVKYDNYDSNATLQSKLLTGKSGYDVVYPSVEYAGKQIKAGIFRPLDKALLPNLQHIDPAVLKALEAADPGNRFLVPYMWFTTGVAINVQKVEQALGGKLPEDAWSLLFDPAVTARLKGCGIALMDEASDVIPAAMIFAGLDPTKMDKASIAKAVDRIRAVRKDIRTFKTAPIDEMAKGSLCAAQMFSGDAMIAGKRARESNTGVNIRYLIPASGAMMSVDVMAIPKDAAHPLNAHRWIDRMMDPKEISRISNETFYFSANKTALPMTSSELTGNPAINPSDAVKAKLRAKPVLEPAIGRELTQALSRFKAAR